MRTMWLGEGKTDPPHCREAADGLMFFLLALFRTMKAKKKKESEDSLSLNGLWLRFQSVQKGVVVRGQNGREVVFIGDR